MTLLNVMNEILLIKQSIPARSFELAKKSFDLSNDYREQAQIQSGNWILIAKALLAGYSDNIFVSKRDLQDRTHHFLRYNNAKDTAVLDFKSILIQSKKQLPVSIVVARDIL
ncbi:unnamed protein product [Rotaria sp. Silwood2]|nr:unnamed protein product [Rotaria sp. Silwood2]CAF4492774.1 unnamed protein product [Rotaria sp. Silwood2]